MRNGDPRLLRGTAGQILVLLYNGEHTVSELAIGLGLADNTVRAHLASLESNGLVEQRGLRRGSRRPHHAYHLTAAAEQLFLKSCDPVLDKLLEVLAARAAPEDLVSVLREAGHRMAAPYILQPEAADRARRIEKALEVLRELGGVVDAQQEEGAMSIRGYRCPLSVVVDRHPEVCALAETLISDIVGVPALERCDKGNPPRCRFQLAMQASP